MGGKKEMENEVKETEKEGWINWRKGGREGGEKKWKNKHKEEKG